MKSQSAELILTLDPVCLYKIRVQRADLIERIACLIRDRWTFVYPVVIGLLLLTIGQRIDCNNENKTNPTAIIIISVVIFVGSNLILECFVGIAILHLMAIGICSTIVFFGSIARNIAVR